MRSQDSIEDNFKLLGIDESPHQKYEGPDVFAMSIKRWPIVEPHSIIQTDTSMAERKPDAQLEPGTY